MYRRRRHSEEHGWWDYCVVEDLERVQGYERTPIDSDEFAEREPA